MTIRKLKGELVEIVFDRMFKKFVKELFKGSSKENLGHESHRDSNRKKKKPKVKQTLTKEQFLYQMDDGTQISKFLLEPAFLRELYLFELATTVALLRENMLSDSRDITDIGDLSGSLMHDLSSLRSKKKSKQGRKQRLQELYKRE